jgi:glycine cleavage system H protein
MEATKLIIIVVALLIVAGGVTGLIVARGRRAAAGPAIEQFGELGTLESTKAVFEVIAPLSGTVVAVNEALVEQPELANEDPYGAGWVAVLAPQDYAEDQELLLDGAGYAALVQRKAAEAGR